MNEKDIEWHRDISSRIRKGQVVYEKLGYDGKEAWYKSSEQVAIEEDMSAEELRSRWGKIGSMLSSKSSSNKPPNEPTPNPVCLNDGLSATDTYIFALIEAGWICTDRIAMVLLNVSRALPSQARTKMYKMGYELESFEYGWRITKYPPEPEPEPKTFTEAEVNKIVKEAVMNAINSLRDDVDTQDEIV